MRASRWIMWIALAMPVTAFAQPDVRDHRHDRHDEGGPTEEPPPAREENMAPRAGFVFVHGHWDWKGKWDWVPGHWERERAGKHWRAGRWDHKDSKWVYVEGDWEAGEAAPPPAAPPPATPPPPGMHPPPA